MFPLIFFNAEDSLLNKAEESFKHSLNLRKNDYLLSTQHFHDDLIIHHDKTGTVKDIGDDNVNLMELVLVIVGGISFLDGCFIVVLEVGGSKAVEGVLSYLVPCLSEYVGIVLHYFEGFNDPVIAEIGEQEDENCKKVFIHLWFFKK